MFLQKQALQMDQSQHNYNKKIITIGLASFHFVTVCTLYCSRNAGLQ